MIPATDRLPSPLVGSYLVQNRRSNRILKTIDAILRIFFRPGAAVSLSRNPKRLLLCNGAHLGDVLISTALLPILRENFPGAEIAFLAGSWARSILEGNQILNRVHVMDHWFHNRVDKSVKTRLARHLRTSIIALMEIRKARYDVAIDLYYHFGNSIPLIWRAGIPARIGYATGGFGPLLTHRAEWRYADRHVLDYQLDLLRMLPIGFVESSGLCYSLPQFNGEVINSGKVASRPYVVFHMGTGLALKEWPPENWRSLAEHFGKSDLPIDFTGLGAREEALAETVVRNLKGCRNLCNKLDWRGFVSAIRGASLVVCSDSLAAHIAAAFERPSIVFSTGINNPNHWRPLSSYSQVLVNSVPCMPCFSKSGCEGMECIRKITVSEVYMRALAMLNRD